MPSGRRKRDRDEEEEAGTVLEELFKKKEPNTDPGWGCGCLTFLAIGFFGWYTYTKAQEWLDPTPKPLTEEEILKEFMPRPGDDESSFVRDRYNNVDLAATATAFLERAMSKDDLASDRKNAPNYWRVDPPVLLAPNTDYVPTKLELLIIEKFHNLPKHYDFYDFTIDEAIILEQYKGKSFSARANFGFVPIENPSGHSDRFVSVSIEENSVERFKKSSPLDKSGGPRQDQLVASR